MTTLRLTKLIHIEMHCVTQFKSNVNELSGCIFKFFYFSFSYFDDLVQIFFFCIPKFPYFTVSAWHVPKSLGKNSKVMSAQLLNLADFKKQN